MKTQIVVVNGQGRAGKDTFCELCGKYAECYVYSSVDKVKEIARLAGWDGGKSEVDRKFLSDLKDLLTAYNDLPMESMKDAVLWNRCKYDVIFLMIREPSEISRAVKEFGASTLLVKRNQMEQIVSNHADRDVELYDYDYTVYNYGTLDDLEQCAAGFIRNLLSGELEHTKDFKYGTKTNPDFMELPPEAKELYEKIMNGTCTKE